MNIKDANLKPGDKFSVQLEYRGVSYDGTYYTVQTDGLSPGPSHLNSIGVGSFHSIKSTTEITNIVRARPELIVGMVLPYNSYPDRFWTIIAISKPESRVMTKASHDSYTFSTMTFDEVYRRLGY